MVRWLNYTITDTVYESDKTIVHRGIRESDARPVMLKRLNYPYPSPEKLEQFRQEYERTRSLAFAGAVQVYGLENDENSLLMVLEDFGGKSLHQLLQGKSMEVSTFLSVAVRLAEMLVQLHEKRLIHKDINPSNIVWNPDSDQLKLIDFGIAQELSDEPPSPSGTFEGTLAYMPPEQTGRMNHRLDERSDLYSLGFTFYELLTGQRPFQTTDAMELIHSHFARRPQPPHEVSPGIPMQLSRLLLKLMAKAPADRYQSAYGLCADLRRCQHQLSETGEISEFALGQEDQATQLDLSRELIGRTQAWQALQDTYQKARQGTLQIAFITGEAGMGKSRLLKELQRQISQAESPGYSAEGRFAPFQHQEPYTALVESFRQLLRRILSEDAASRAQWGEAVRQTLGDNGEVLFELLPALTALTGPLPAAPSLPPQQAQYRFQRTLLQLLHTLAHQAAPLVLYWDDLHWCDAATLWLLEALADDPLPQPLLIVSTYCPEELSPGALQALLRLQQKTRLCTQVALTALPLEQLETALAAALRRPDVAGFAAICHQKTKGNPFFVQQFLHTLCKDKVLHFSPTDGHWEWSLAQVEAMPLSANVVEWMAQKMDSSSPAVHQLLPLAACIGNRWTLSRLLQLSEVSEEDALATLQEAHNDGLIYPVASTSWSPANEQNDQQAYRFAHERIQQAAYHRLSQEERQRYHLRIGQMLWQAHQEEIPHDALFSIAHQMNLGAPLLASPDAQVRLAQLNLDAGRHAKRTAAHELAAHFFDQGLALLQTFDWAEQYQQRLALHQERAEIAYFRADFATLQEHAKAIKENAASLLDKIDIHSLEIQALISQHRPKDALHLALGILAQLGIRLPLEPGLPHIIMGLIRTQRMLSSTSPEALVDHPEMTAPDKLAAMHLLSRSSLDFAAFLCMPKLFPLIVLEQVRLSFRDGHTPDSSVAYVSYAMLLCGALQKYELGRRYGDLGLALLERFEAKELRSKVIKLYNGFVAHWSGPIKDTLVPLMDAYQAGQDTGFLDSMVGAGFVHAYHSFFFVGQLNPLQALFAQRKQIAHKAKQEVHVNYYSCYQQLLHQLQSDEVQSDEAPSDDIPSDDVPSEAQATTPHQDGIALSGIYYNATEMLPRQLDAKDHTGLFLYHFLSTFWHHISQQHDAAIAHARLAGAYTESAMGSVGPPLIDYFHALSCLCLIPESRGWTRLRRRSRVRKIRKQLARWAAHAPANYLAKHLLLEAEWHRITNNYRQAVTHYEKAMSAAREHGSLLDEAMANEYAGRFLSQCEQHKAAQSYLRDAHHLYRQWGATTKVKALALQYPLLQINSARATALRTPHTTTQSTTTSLSTEGDSRNLDLHTILKATQAISETIILGQLLAKLMQFAIENAGAQSGFLLLHQDEEWRVEAAGHAEQSADKIQVLQSQEMQYAVSFDGTPQLCEAIIRTVAREHQPIVLANASEDRMFADLPYVRQTAPKSILCMPLMHQNQVQGILYLENKLTTGAFTQERLTVLRTVSAQAAISIENARLYNQLEERVTERTQQLQQANEQLSITHKHLENKHQQLLDAQGHLVQSEKMAGLGTLVSGIAHELNNPLSFTHSGAHNIQRRLEALRDQLTQLDPQSLQDIGIDNIDDTTHTLFLNLQAIMDGSQRMSELVKDLQTFSQHDQAKRKRTSVGEGLKSTLSLLQTTYSQQTVKMLCNLINDPPIVCWPAQLNQLFMNITLNACQAIIQKQLTTPHDNETGLVQWTTSAVDDNLVMTCADNGIGIEPAQLARVYEPFFTTKAVGEGVGLGLSVAYNIVQQHEGHLTINSTPGQGTQVTIQLPIKAKKKKATSARPARPSP